MAGYYGRRFGVKLDPDREVIATLGSKEGFANLAQALTAPGDVIICPNPAYPIHAYGFIMAGGVIRHVPAGSPEEYLAGISRAVKHSAPPPSVLIVSYPSNPTAQWVDLDFYKEIVALAKKHDLLVLSDIAYSEIYFDDNPPPSLLQVDGAKDIAVEVNSLSKTFAMAGWRVGMVVGQRAHVRGAGAGEVLPGLRRLHPDPGGGRRRPERSAATASTRSGRSTSRAATPWWTP